jgi:hypothetical protein
LRLSSYNPSTAAPISSSLELSNLRCSSLSEFAETLLNLSSPDGSQLLRISTISCLGGVVVDTDAGSISDGGTGRRRPRRKLLGQYQMRQAEHLEAIRDRPS